jgi:hypothetical protein
MVAMAIAAHWLGEKVEVVGHVCMVGHAKVHS